MGHTHVACSCRWTGGKQPLTFRQTVVAKCLLSVGYPLPAAQQTHVVSTGARWHKRGCARGGQGEKRDTHHVCCRRSAAHAGEEAMPASGGHGTAPGDNPAGAARSKVARCEMCEMCECDTLRFKLGELHASRMPDTYCAVHVASRVPAAPFSYSSRHLPASRAASPPAKCIVSAQPSHHPRKGTRGFQAARAVRSEQRGCGTIRCG